MGEGWDGSENSARKSPLSNHSILPIHVNARSAMYLAKVYIQLRPTVSDPQGHTIRGGLLQLGFDSVTSVRAGKYMEITLEADTEAHASDQVRDMCDKLLANPVIEDYRFDLEQFGIYRRVEG